MDQPVSHEIVQFRLDFRFAELEVFRDLLATGKASRLLAEAEQFHRCEELEMTKREAFTTNELDAVDDPFKGTNLCVRIPAVRAVRGCPTRHRRLPFP